MKHWAASLIGKPYATGGVGPDEFYCVGLVQYFFKVRHGILLPAYELGDGFLKLYRFVKATGWRRVEGPPQDEDVLVARGPFGWHTGVVIKTSEGLGLLHAEGNDKKGSVIWQPLHTLVAYTEKTYWRKP